VVSISSLLVVNR